MLQSSSCSVPFIDIKEGVLSRFNIIDAFMSFFVSQSLLYKVVNALIRNSKRVRSSHFKCKSGLVGSGRKIRPQKGTGKARQGTCKEIHMRGGAVKFGFSGDKYKDAGKRYRSYSFLNKKEKSRVFLAIIADKLRSDCMYFFNADSDEYSKDAKNFNGLRTFVRTQNLNKEKIVFIYKNKDLKSLFGKMFSIKSIFYSDINILDLLRAEKFICERHVLDYFIGRLESLEKK